MKISKNDKKDWIIEYMTHPEHRDHFIDITGEEFVNAYVDKFEPEVIKWYPYGTPKFPEIGELLAELYKENKLSRRRHYRSEERRVGKECRL